VNAGRFPELSVDWPNAGYNWLPAKWAPEWKKRWMTAAEGKDATTMAQPMRQKRFPFYEGLTKHLSSSAHKCWA
jgi:hypothetical protein